MATSSAAYSAFPDEVVRQIVLNLSTLDLQNARLVDRKLCRSASEVFFSTFTLINDWKAMEKAQQIGLPPTWVESVRHVVWGPCIRDTNSASVPTIQDQYTLINKLPHVKSIQFFGPTDKSLHFLWILNYLRRGPGVILFDGVKCSLTYRDHKVESLLARSTQRSDEDSNSLGFSPIDNVYWMLGSVSFDDKDCFHRSMKLRPRSLRSLHLVDMKVPIELPIRCISEENCLDVVNITDVCMYNNRSNSAPGCPVYGLLIFAVSRAHSPSVSAPATVLNLTRVRKLHWKGSLCATNDDILAWASSDSPLEFHQLVVHKLSVFEPKEGYFFYLDRLKTPWGKVNERDPNHSYHLMAVLERTFREDVLYSFYPTLDNRPRILRIFQLRRDGHLPASICVYKRDDHDSTSNLDQA